MIGLDGDDDVGVGGYYISSLLTFLACMRCRLCSGAGSIDLLLYAFLCVLVSWHMHCCIFAFFFLEW